MKTAISIILLATLAGCSSPRLVDLQSSKNPGEYQNNLFSCQQLAESSESKMGNVLSDGAMSMVIASVTAVAFAILTKSKEPLSMVAALGAGGGLLGGGIAGALRTDTERYDIVTKCLEGRGYSVLR